MDKFQNLFESMVLENWKRKQDIIKDPDWNKYPLVDPSRLREPKLSYSDIYKGDVFKFGYMNFIPTYSDVFKATDCLPEEEPVPVTAIKCEPGELTVSLNPGESIV